jgi:uncharacterized membrane protein YedE/YeeE
MTPLSPFAALSGGAMIGIAAGLLLLLSGRIAGVSGMAARATGLSRSGVPWSQAAAFLLGVPAGAAQISTFGRQPQVTLTSSVPLLLIAGLVVGFGTRWGNGCTSGHGVCGVARLSPRSIAATLAFISAGMAVVFIARHLVRA